VSLSSLATPALAADTPAAWLAEQLAGRYDLDPDRGDEPALVRPGWTGLLELIDAGVIEEVHGRLVADGKPPKVASTCSAGRFGAAIAEAIGFGLAAGGAGFVTPEHVRVHVHEGGWVDAVELEGARTLVVGDHPWAGQDGVEVASPEEVLAGSVHALVEACAPIVDACRSLATVGRAGLWNEIGDSLGSSLAYQDRVTSTPAMLAVLDAAVRVPGVPWSATPTLRIVHSDVVGPVHVAQKGGCCLAYTVDQAGDDDVDTDADLRAFRERFPVDDGPRYCGTCSFRTPEDCDARRLFWLEREVLLAPWDDSTDALLLVADETGNWRHAVPTETGR
jgi:hypothetical protein